MNVSISVYNYKCKIKNYYVVPGRGKGLINYCHNYYLYNY